MMNRNACGDKTKVKNRYWDKGNYIEEKQGRIKLIYNYGILSPSLLLVIYNIKGGLTDDDHDCY